MLAKLGALVAYELTVEGLVNHFTGLEEIIINLDSYSNLHVHYIYICTSSSNKHICAIENSNCSRFTHSSRTTSIWMLKEGATRLRGTPV